MEKRRAYPFIDRVSNPHLILTTQKPPTVFSSGDLHFHPISATARRRAGRSRTGAAGELSLAIIFSNRCFPTKALAIWQALDHDAHGRLVALYLADARFAEVEIRTLMAPGSGSDPLFAVIGRAPHPDSK